MVISLIDKKEIKFIILKSPKVPKIIISDYKKLNQILLNLLGNAVKFTQTGRINLFIHQKEDRITFEVSDTGIGISEENLSIIFERFRQIDNSESKEYKGTGLGLHISKNYVEMLGGNITVESIPGKGTTMKFFIPAEETLSKADIQADQTFKSLASQINMDIELNLPLAVIIDDNKQNCFWYATLLKEFGYSVLTCLNSNTGFLAVKQYLPDLVILKFEMPKIHGQFIIHQITEIESLNSIPIIIISNIESLQLKNISNPYSIVNEPVREKDLMEQLDELSDYKISRQPIDHIILCERNKCYLDSNKCNHCFQSTSLSISKLLMVRWRIKSLVLCGFEENGIHMQLTNWLATQPDLLPQNILINADDELYIDKNMIDNLNSKIKIPVSLISESETIQLFH
jgi:CheY-like chemotaxis protein